ncbi:MAG: hypothetical protein ORN98_01295 [Alphaproteobacteria bacterium]|nr:hypothetical protein [Alphaproteobacteria bacterium]
MNERHLLPSRLKVRVGMGTTLQDHGRLGWRHAAVPRAGALDPYYLAAANLLVGNCPFDSLLESSAERVVDFMSYNFAALELGYGWTELAPVDTPMVLGIAGGHIDFILHQDDRLRKLVGWQSVMLQPGEKLRLRRLGGENCYVALRGGFAVPETLGSRSDYGLAHLGMGLLPDEAAPCVMVDEIILPVNSVIPPDFASDAVKFSLFQAGQPWAYRPGPIRVLLGPHYNWFTPESRARFFDRAWQKSSSSNRMGMRLMPFGHAKYDTSELLTRLPSHKGEILSQGVIEGNIQLPSDGKPIILVNDAQTTGGYPIFATVISADLPRLSHMFSDEEIRFTPVTLVEAIAAKSELDREFAAWCQNLQPIEDCVDLQESSETIDLHALYAENLISGAVG